MSKLSITKSQIQGDISVTVLHLKGQLDRMTSNDLLDRAREAHEDGAAHLLIDLSSVDMLTSSGLLAIQSIFKMFAPDTDMEIMRHHHEEPYKSPYMKLVCPDPKIYYILNIAGFLQNILIYNNMDEAIKSFDG
jgi:anti-anti-sigma regulatory factor